MTAYPGFQGRKEYSGESTLVWGVVCVCVFERQRDETLLLRFKHYQKKRLRNGETMKFTFFLNSRVKY